MVFMSGIQAKSNCSSIPKLAFDTRALEHLVSLNLLDFQLSYVFFLPQFCQHPVTRDCTWGRSSEDADGRRQGCLTWKPPTPWVLPSGTQASIHPHISVTSKKQRRPWPYFCNRRIPCHEEGGRGAWWPPKPPARFQGLVFICLFFILLLFLIF